MKEYLLLSLCIIISSFPFTLLLVSSTNTNSSGNEFLNKIAGFKEENSSNNTITRSSILSSNPANQAESMMAPFLNPMSIMSSTIDQIRNSTGSNEHNNNLNNNNTNVSIVRDSTTILLGMKVIPPKDFIPLYDSTPYKIINGHVIAKLPCDTRSESQLKILVGHIPNLKPVQLELVKELSSPGYMCLYYLDLFLHNSTMISSNNDGNTNMINSDYDMVLFNPTNSTIKLPHTSTVIIGVNEIVL